MTLEIALAQAALGREVFPVRGKVPLVKWTKQATAKERVIRMWWRAYPDAGVGWKLPEGVVIVDVDNPEKFFDAGLETPPAPGQQTPRGFHLLYTLNPSREAHQGPIPGGDIKVGGKGYVRLYSTDAFTRRLSVGVLLGATAAHD